MDYVITIKINKDDESNNCKCNNTSVNVELW